MKTFSRRRRATVGGMIGLAAGAAAAAVPSRLFAQAAAPEADASTGAAPDPFEAVGSAAEPLPDISDEGFAHFIDRFRDARVILLGEQSHGTDEFYRARAAITRRLVAEHGFNVIALEADWPDAARMDAYVRAHAALPDLPSPFLRFPAWMWRNRAVMAFLEDLRAINAGIAEPEKRAGIYGLDLYSLPSSMDAVLGFLERQDPQAAVEVRERYGCLSPWVDKPEAYGALSLSEPADSCAENVMSVISEVLGKRFDHIDGTDRGLFDALQNARVVAAAEAYYRAMYEGGSASWNLRDTHMFETLQAVLSARGDSAKAVIWAHNSHIGDASATEMGRRGEINIGQLVRETFGESSVLIGFGTDRGTVTAASEWNGPAETKTVRPALPESFGRVLRDAGPERFLLDFRAGNAALTEALTAERLERFIGVLYLPETERWSHYAGASLARQFDAFVWFEETRAVEPIPSAELRGLPQTHPFSVKGGTGAG